MSLQDAIFRTVAAEGDWQRRLKLAMAMIAGQETGVLMEIYERAFKIRHSASTSVEEKNTAISVIESLALGLLTRVEVMDEEFEQLLDENFEIQFGFETCPINYDTEDGFTTVLEPDPHDVPGDRDLMLDVWAEPDAVGFSMRVNIEGGPRLTGRLDVESVSELERALYLARTDADQLGKVEEDDTE